MLDSKIFQGRKICECQRFGEIQDKRQLGNTRELREETKKFQKFENFIERPSGSSAVCSEVITHRGNVRILVVLREERRGFFEDLQNSSNLEKKNLA